MRAVIGALAMAVLALSPAHGAGAAPTSRVPAEVVPVSRARTVHLPVPTTEYTLSVRSGYAAWAWGLNLSGRLGDGTTTERHLARRIGSSTSWANISAGAYHTCATRSSRTLWCWGNNENGQLGDGTTTDRHTPTRIPGAPGWASVSTGAHYKSPAYTETLRDD